MLLMIPLAMAALSSVQASSVLHANVRGNSNLRVNVRGNGVLTCATAFLPENSAGTGEWIAGFWAAWDMAEIHRAKPVAQASDLNGILGEVRKVCEDQPSTPIVKAVMATRKVIASR